MVQVKLDFFHLPSMADVEENSKTQKGNHGPRDLRVFEHSLQKLLQTSLEFVQLPRLLGG